MKPTDALHYRRILQDAFEAAPDAGTLDGLTTGSGGTWADWLPDTTVYYVSADMTAVARAAGRQMPRQTLQADDPPSPHGFLVYDEPLTFLDRDEGAAPIRGFAWTTTDVPVYEELDGPLDSDGVEPHTWAPGVEVLVLYDTAAVGGPVGLLLPVTEMTWAVGEEPVNAETEPYREGIAGPLLATWTLMQQSLSVTVPSQASRAEQRRWFRRRLQPPAILIVRLRRLGHGGDSEQGTAAREWSHRWLVGGHWRNQWLPSRNAHRLQWISPYVKGPANLPLLVKDRVTAWVR